MISQKGHKLHPVFFHYLEWEDYKNGMYAKPGDNQEELIQQSINLFRDSERLKQAMQRVLKEWPLSSMQNLSSGNLNRRSWLGQAACCIDHKIPEIINRNAWNALTEHQMKEANRVADELINEWEKNNNRHEKIFRNQCIRSGAIQGVLEF